MDNLAQYFADIRSGRLPDPDPFRHRVQRAAKIIARCTRAAPSEARQRVLVAILDRKERRLAYSMADISDEVTESIHHDALLGYL